MIDRNISVLFMQSVGKKNRLFPVVYPRHFTLTDTCHYHHYVKLHIMTVGERYLSRKKLTAVKGIPSMSISIQTEWTFGPKRS